tara:strand:+ start:197 stop:532 length:336 start_codon:yes stop_codon:yes gene_type:complete
MNSLKEIEELKSLTEKISAKARLDKAAVDSLIRQREKLKAKKYLKYRLDSTQKDAEMKAKCDDSLTEIDEKLDALEIRAGSSWAKLESHRIHIDLLRSYISTKREELKQGL